MCDLVIEVIIDKNGIYITLMIPPPPLPPISAQRFPTTLSDSHLINHTLTPSITQLNTLTQVFYKISSIISKSEKHRKIPWLSQYHRPLYHGNI